MWNRHFHLIQLIILCQLSLASFSRPHEHRGDEAGLDVHKGNSTVPPGVFNATNQTENVDSVSEKPPVTQFPTTRGTVAETPIPILFRKAYDKLPVWDFEDTYNQDAAPRQTVSMSWRDKVNHWKGWALELSCVSWASVKLCDFGVTCVHVVIVWMQTHLMSLNHFPLCQLIHGFFHNIKMKTSGLCHIMIPCYLSSRRVLSLCGTRRTRVSRRLSCPTYACSYTKIISTWANGTDSPIFLIPLGSWITSMTVCVGESCVSSIPCAYCLTSEGTKHGWLPGMFQFNHQLMQ